MKKAMILVAALAGAAFPLTAFADPTAAAPAPAPAHFTTNDTTIGVLLADPAAKGVIEKHYPGLTTSASITMANSMTLHQLQQFKPDVFTDKSLAETDVDLARLPAR